MDLLPKHRHLLEEDIGELCGSTSGHQATWVASVELDLAPAEADHVSAGLHTVNVQAAYVSQTRHQRAPSQLNEVRTVCELDTLKT